MNYIKKIYSGRINRKNYFLGLVFFFILLILVAIAVSLMGFSKETNDTIFGLLTLFLVFYVLSLHVRRLHDFGESGWFIFIFMIPLFNLILLLQLLFAKSNDGDNKYGEPLSKNTKILDAIFNKNYEGAMNKAINDGKKQYCANCGEEVDADSKFCGKCGARNINTNK